jgi:hypothetical protein
MGHLNKASYQYYHSASSGIDIQSIIHNRKPKEKLIQANQSMKLRRDVGAPQPPGALLTDVVGPRTVDKDASHLGKRQQYDLAKKAQRLDFNERRKAFFEKENEGNQESESEDEEEEADDDNIVIVEAKTDIRSPSRYLRAFLRYESNRQKIIDVLFTKQGSSMIDIIGALIRLRYRERERIEYPKAPIGDGDRCPDCNKQLRIPKVRLDRTHSHLLGCARSRFIKEGRKNMKHRFENSLGSCQWNDCGYKFKLKSDGTYTNHVSNHLIRNKSNQCLWGHCGFLAPSIQELALHVSEKHGVPNDLTTPTRMYFCYEHGQYFAAEFDWLKHCALHRDRLTDFCGLIRRHGIVMVGAHCLFCLNDGGLDFGSRWRQFADPFTLHVHMKEHLASSGPPSTCPHPKCDDKLGSESAFWAHASSVHGIPPLGPTRDRKRNATDDEDDAGGEASKRCRALNES